MFQGERAALRLRLPKVNGPNDRGSEVAVGDDVRYPVAAHVSGRRMNGGDQETEAGRNTQAENNSPNVMPPGNSKPGCEHPQKEQHPTTE